MQFPPQTPGWPLTALCRSTAENLARLIRMAWRAHRDLLDRNLVYQALMIIAAQVILAQLDLGQLTQVLRDLTNNLLH